MSLRTACRSTWVLAVWLALPSFGQSFVDAPDSGLDFQHENGATGRLTLAEIMGPGGALLDFDNDGDLDVYLPQGVVFEPGAPQAAEPPTDRLFRNELAPSTEGRPRLRFSVVPAGSTAPPSYGMGLASGDYDGDGKIDIYVAALGRNRLLRNRGDGNFEDTTAQAGVEDVRWSIAASFFDYNRDGHLDLFVVNYVDFQPGRPKLCPDPTGVPDYCGPSAYSYETNRLFRNRGDGTFDDVSTKSKIDAKPAPGLAAVAADFDGDGWQDLYVANDGVENFLFMNQRDGTFREDAMFSGCAVSGEGLRQASMGVGAADLDADGDEDLLMTHLFRDTNTFYQNDGSALFRDESAASGLGPPSWLLTGFGVGFPDLDNDGFKDVLVVNGHVTNFAGGGKGLAQGKLLLKNQGGGRFSEVPHEPGSALARPEVSRGAAFGDLDNDGDTDVLVINNHGPARILLSDASSLGAWLGLRLATGEPPRDALGAVVTLIPPGPRAAGEPRVRRARVGTDGSYASAQDPRILFGLGKAPAARYRIEVRWPDGRREEFQGLEPGAYTTLRQGAGRDLPSS